MLLIFIKLPFVIKIFVLSILSDRLQRFNCSLYIVILVSLTLMYTVDVIMLSHHPRNFTYVSYLKNNQDCDE